MLQVVSLFSRNGLFINFLPLSCTWWRLKKKKKKHIPFIWEINEIMVRKLFVHCSKVWTIVSCWWYYYCHLQRPSINDVACLCAKLPQSCPALCDPMDCSPPGSSVHGDSPGKYTGVSCHALLHGYSQPRDRTQVSHIAGGFFTIWAMLLFLKMSSFVSSCVKWGRTISISRGCEVTISSNAEPLVSTG